MSHLGNTIYSQTFNSQKQGFFPSKTASHFYRGKSPQKKMLQLRIQLKKDLIELTHNRENCQLQLSQLAALGQREKTRLQEIQGNQKNFEKKQEKHLLEIEALKKELLEVQL